MPEPADGTPRAAPAGEGRDRLYIGLMSGTSLDAIDGVLTAFPEADSIRRANPDRSRRIETIGFASLPIDGALRAELWQLQSPSADELARSRLASIALAEQYARVVRSLLGQCGIDARDVVAIGAHGQTVRHRPDQRYTIQLLDGAVLAEATGIDVVCDFRAADIAAGGQGAPLVPAFHAHVFGRPDVRRAIVNIGGIANVTLLTGDQTALGYDTGPGNLLMDLWTARHQGTRYDADGRWAGAAAPGQALLGRMLADPYFAKEPPKSTGRDHFHAAWLDAMLGREAAGATSPSSAEVQSTLCELTAITIAEACRGFGATELFVCGGGARNAELMRRLRARTEPARVADTTPLGLEPQAVEAAAFAWLAMRRIARLPANLPQATGARGPRMLGAIHAAGIAASH